MSDLSEWQRFLDENAGGNHLVGWTSTDGFLRDLMSRFLGQGLDRNELVFVVLPRDELGALDLFTWRGERLEALTAFGRVRIVALEEVVAEGRGPAEAWSDAIRRVLGSMIREAGDGGYAGARILGRVAPVFFERAEDDIAMEIEESVRLFQRYCSALCLYRTASFDEPRRARAAVRISHAHTHSILELPDGGVVCAPWPPDVPAGGRG